MKKLFIAFAAVAVLLFSSLTADRAQAQTFTDVDQSKEYYEAVEQLVQAGVFTKASKFNPSKEVTRGDLAQFLAIALKLDTKNVKNPKFKDVPTSHKQYKYIAALVEAKIISGYSDGTYGVNKKVTRGQMAKFLVKGFDLQLTIPQYVDFADLKEGSEVYNNAATLSHYEITTSYKYNPSNSVKRSQIALFLARTLQVKEKAAKELRLTTKNVGVKSFDAIEQGILELPTNEKVVSVAYNTYASSKQLIITPLTPGKTALLVNEDVTPVILLLDVAEDLSITYRIADTMPTAYKAQLPITFGNPPTEISESSAHTLNLDIEEKLYISDKDVDGPFELVFYSFDQPDQLWEIDVHYKDGQSETYYAFTVETAYDISALPTYKGNAQSVTYSYTEEDAYTGDVFYHLYGELTPQEAYADVSVELVEREYEDLYTSSVTFTKEGTYHFTNIYDEPYTFKVIRVNGDLYVSGGI